MEPDKNFEVQNENIEIPLKEIGQIIKDQLPEGWGFSLLMFDFHKTGGGNTFYVSSGQREDVLNLMQEFIDKQRGTKK